jgi:hypothetical protein
VSGLVAGGLVVGVYFGGAFFSVEPKKTGLSGGSVPARCAGTAWPPQVAPRPLRVWARY